MKRTAMISILSLLVVQAMAYAAQQRTDGPFKQTSVVGTWHGKMDELPAVDLVIKEDGGKLAGTVVFYRVTDEGNGPKVSGKAELALIDAKFDDSTLTFAFKRRDGGEAKAQMKMVNDQEAMFKLIGGPPAQEEMKMIREK